MTTRFSCQIALYLLGKQKENLQWHYIKCHLHVGPCSLHPFIFVFTSWTQENKPVKGRFQGLDIEDDGPAADDGDDDLEVVTSAQKSKKQKKKKRDETATETTESTETKRTAADNDDIEDEQNEDKAMEANGNGIVNEPEVSASKKSKKKKKEKKDFDFEDDSGDDVKEKPAKKTDDAAKKVETETAPDEGGTMKTAAQKRAEKKEREKKKKEAEKAKAKAKSKNDESKTEASVDDKTEEVKVETESPADKEGETGAASLSGTSFTQHKIGQFNSPYWLPYIP